MRFLIPATLMLALVTMALPAQAPCVIVTGVDAVACVGAGAGEPGAIVVAGVDHAPSDTRVTTGAAVLTDEPRVSQWGYVGALGTVYERHSVRASPSLVCAGAKLPQQHLDVEQCARL